MDEFIYKPKENSQIRMGARNAIRGNLWQFWQMLLVYSLVSALLSYILELCFGNSIQDLSTLLAAAADDIPREVSYGPTIGYYVTNSVFSLLLIPVSYGITRTTSLWARGVATSKWQNMIEKYKGFKPFFKVLGLAILKYILIALWCVLLVVPGIIKALAYSQTTYLLYDEPELSIWQTLKKSEEMMKGYKGKLFLMYLSFIGWFIAGAFTFGILYIWVVPYCMMSLAIFYDELRRGFYNDDPAQNPESRTPHFTPNSSADSPFGDDETVSAPSDDDKPFSDF